MSRFGTGIAMLLIACAADISRAGAQAPEIDADVRDAVASGPARVIVELRIPGEFQPEGALNEVAAGAQRQAIAEAQRGVIDGLAGSQFRVTRQQATVPFLALEIGADALAKLETMTERVARVYEDKTLSVQ